jgi:hypothetical protein
MGLNEFVKQLRCYLGNTDATYLLGKRKESFVQIIGMVERDASVCEKNEVPSPLTPTGINLIMDSLKYLLAVLNEQVISEEGSKFIESYSTLIYNWNNNIHKNEDFSLLTQTLNRFVNLRLTTVELLQNLRMVSKTIKELSHVGFQPTQLSKHYLASFDKQNQ